MAQASKTLINLLSMFLMTEIESRVLSGITYTMLFKDQKSTKDKEDYERYIKIRHEANNCGYGPNDLFRVFEVSNGYIFDMDLGTAKQITFEVSKSMNQITDGKTPVGDLIGDSPEKRRKEDMVALSKYVKSQVNEGNNVIEVALFSRNSVPRIVFNGEDNNGKPCLVKYNAFAIRHWDIEEINTRLLLPAGIKISKIEPCEVLPPKTGVRFVLHAIKL